MKLWCQAADFCEVKFWKCLWTWSQVASDVYGEIICLYIQTVVSLVCVFCFWYAEYERPPMEKILAAFSQINTVYTFI